MSILEFVVYTGIKEETFGISSSSTSREDYEARHKSRHLMNMTLRAQDRSMKPENSRDLDRRC
jgi:hypothetical protein